MSESPVFSIYLPHVLTSVSEEQLRRVFGPDGLGWGEIQRVDVANKRDHDTTANMVFIHFSEWTAPEHPADKKRVNLNTGKTVREMLDEGARLKVVHSDPAFWWVSKANPPAPFIVFPEVSKTNSIDQPVIRTGATEPDSPSIVVCSLCGWFDPDSWGHPASCRNPDCKDRVKRAQQLSDELRMQREWTAVLGSKDKRTPKQQMLYDICGPPSSLRP